LTIHYTTRLTLIFIQKQHTEAIVTENTFYDQSKSAVKQSYATEYDVMAVIVDTAALEILNVGSMLQEQTHQTNQVK